MRRILYRDAASLPSPAPTLAGDSGSDTSSTSSADAAPASESRVRSLVASTEGVDRYNTRILAAGWELDNYRRNPVILWGHDHKQAPIGMAGVSLDASNRLIADVEFFTEKENPLAETVLRLLDRGVLAVSVGFDPKESTYVAERESGDPWTDLVFPPLDYTRTELLEISVVTVPGNADALPVGRGLAPEHLERLAPRLRSALERVAPVKPPPAPAKPGLTDEQIRAMVARIVSEETRAAVARTVGNLGSPRRK